ncbi:MAG: S41 family peptidase [Oscillochloridaceae bacterium umkhey_bin13]
MNASSPLDLLRIRLPIWLASLLIGLALAIGLGVGLLGGLIVSQVNAPVANCPESREVCEEFAIFWEAWDLARTRFVDEAAADPALMTAGAINGMVDSLGDVGHTRFLTVEEAQEWDEGLRGSFEGIGAYIDVRDGQTIIVAPIEGSPAEQAGIRAGDVIIAVDGDATTGWTVDQLRNRVRGPANTPVTLTVIHPGEQDPVEITITRAQVVVPSVTWRMLPDGVALVRLSSFDDRAGRELQTALRDTQAAGATAIIFDLRNNPGGLLDQAIEVASQFLPRGTTVLIEETRNGRRETTQARAGGVALEIPLVVLINENSASSSEIVSGALQDAGRAVLVGETTVGTGTVLTPYRLSDGSRLLLGTRQWLTPEGRLIRGQGIEPDELVPLPIDVAPLLPRDAGELDADELRASPDLQLVRALELASAAARR